MIVRTESLPEQPKPVEPPVEKKEESEDYSDYSYSEYSDEEDEDEDDRRRRLMIQRAAKRNNAQPENKLFSSFFESSKKLINEAELVLLVLNNNEALTADDRELLQLTADKNRIIILNKTDLETNIERSELPSYVETSMVLEQGIEVLENSIKKMFEIGDIGSSDMTYLSNARHIAKLKQAITSIEDAINAMQMGMLVDMVEIDIKNAWYSLGEILGEEIGDSLLDELFSKFCLGK